MTHKVTSLPPELMTMRDVSELTGIPVGTLKYLRHKGDGGPPSFALTPKTVRYKREDVIAWIDERFEAEQQKRVSA